MASSSETDVKLTENAASSTTRAEVEIEVEDAQREVTNPALESHGVALPGFEQQSLTPPPRAVQMSPDAIQSFLMTTGRLPSSPDYHLRRSSLMSLGTHSRGDESPDSTGISAELGMSGYKTESVLFNDTLLAVLVRWGLNLPGSADFESLVPDRSIKDKAELESKGIPFRRCTNCRQWGHDRRNCLLPRKDHAGNIVEFQRHCGLCGSTGHDRRTCYMSNESSAKIGAFDASPTGEGRPRRRASKNDAESMSSDILDSENEEIIPISKYA